VPPGLNLTVNSRVELTNSTLSGNSDNVNNKGSLYAATGSSINLNNTVVTSSSTPNCLGTSGSITADNRNIIEDGSCTTSALSIDPMLGTLTNNGGLTETHALLAGSPAIDGANPSLCPDADQRGEPRDAAGLIFPVVTANSKAALISLDGECDMGAVEF